MEITQETANSIYKAQKAKGVPDEKIKEAILEKFEELRFFNDKSGYIFIYEFNGDVVMVPTNKALTGKNLMDLKDSNGVFFIKELLATAKQGGGIVRYEFPKVKDGKPFPKFAYSVSFGPYSWVMGTGIYVDSVDDEIAKLRAQINSSVATQLTYFLLISLALVILSILMTMFIINKTISSPLKNLMLRADNLSSGDGELTRELTIDSNDEIAEASVSINRFIEKVRILISEAKISLMKTLLFHMSFLLLHSKWVVQLKLLCK